MRGWGHAVSACTVLVLERSIGVKKEPTLDDPPEWAAAGLPPGGAWGGAEAAGWCCAPRCPGRSLVPALMDELRQAGMLHVLVVVGGIIPPQVRSSRGVWPGGTHTQCHAVGFARTLPVWSHQSTTTVPQPGPLPVCTCVCPCLPGAALTATAHRTMRSCTAWVWPPSLAPAHASPQLPWT